MGGCATKPKVKAEKVPAPEVGEELVGDGVKDAVVDEAGREIVQAGEEKKAEAVSFRHSLSNLLNQAVEKEDKAKGDRQQTESIERELESESIKLGELESESIKLEVTIEKGAELIELPKEEQPSELEKQVPIEAERIFYCGKSELVEAENPKLPVLQVVKAVSLKLDEPTKVVAAAAEIPPSSETPKLSEVTKTEEVTPVVPQAVSPKLDEATKVIVAAAAEIRPSSETPKLPEITKTEDATPVVPQSETLNPADSTNTFPAASETLKPSELKKEEAAAATLSETETPKPSVSTKTIDAPAETKNIVQEKESPPPNVEQKPTATPSESANP